MSKILGMPCPHCQSRSQVRTSNQLTATMREVYFLCTSLTCGHSWVAHLEAVRTIAPSGLPNPFINLPMMSRPEIERTFDKLNPSKQRSFFDENN